MSFVMRFSRLSKIAITSATAGSLYLFRDEIKPYLSSLRRTDASKQDAPTQPTTPRYIDDLPESIPYLLIGGGTASHSAMRAIRGQDAKAKVLIISGENYGPYMRPALSKELWYSDRDLRKDLKFRWWNGKERSIFYEIDEFFIPLSNLPQRENGGVSIIKNIRMTHLDPDKRIAYLENGQHLGYEKCLLAPGGIPKSLPAFETAPEKLRERIVYFKTADDFLKLEEIAAKAKRIAIVGGGFLGTELAFALSNQKTKSADKQEIYQIYPEPSNLAKVLPSHLSSWLSQKVRSEGTKLVPDVEIKSISTGPDQSLNINLSNGEELSVDYIICAVGIDPDVKLAKSSGLEVDEKTGGFMVNSELEARTNVWVAGDASSFYDSKLGRRRVEHHDHAINSGKLAGQNMTGAGKAYTHQSMFWSDLGSDISFEAVGIIDSTLPTVSVFVDPNDLQTQEDSSQDTDKDKEPKAGNHSAPTTGQDNYARGVIFYLRDNVIVGILLWNLFNRLKIARRILNEQKEYDDFKEVAKLFNLYLED